MTKIAFKGCSAYSSYLRVRFRFVTMAMSLFLIISCGTSLLDAKEACANVYYIAPKGTDDGAGTSAAPWRTFTRAMSALKPGDTLNLMDGTYTYAANNKGNPFAVLSVTMSGTRNDPVIIRALNEGKAIIDGQKSHNCVSVKGQSWVEINGINFINSGHDVVTVSDGSTYISFRRDIMRDFGWADKNCHSTGAAAFYTADSSHDILLEDSAIYMSGFNGNTICDCNGIRPGGTCANGARMGINNWSSGNTYRRVWIGWDPNLGEVQDTTPFQNYGSSDTIAENCFFNGTNQTRTSVESILLSHVQPYNHGRIANNTALGNIILNGAGFSIIVDDNSTQAHPTNDLLKDNVSIGSKWGFANEGDDNFRVINNTIANLTHGNRGSQPVAANITFSSCSVTDPTSPCYKKGTGVTLNTYGLNNSYYKCTDTNPAYSKQAGGVGASFDNGAILGTIESKYDNFDTCAPIFTDPGKYIKSTPNIPLTIAANYDTATYGNGAYLVVPPRLQGVSKIDGAYHIKTAGSRDIGAEVLYRYQNGVLTNIPLWPWPMEDRIFKETGISVTWEKHGGLWKTLKGLYPSKQK